MFSGINTKVQPSQTFSRLGATAAAVDPFPPEDLPAPSIQTSTVILLIHADQPVNHCQRIGDLIPYESIRSWADSLGATLASVLPDEKIVRFPGDVAFYPATQYWRYPRHEQWQVLDGKTVILAGGFRSLCIKQVFGFLNSRGIDVRINPDWIAPDPETWVRSGGQPWQYPPERLLSFRAVS